MDNDLVREAKERVVKFATEARLHGRFPVTEHGALDITSREYQSYIATLADLWGAVDALLAAESRDADRCHTCLGTKAAPNCYHSGPGGDHEIHQGCLDPFHRGA